MNIRKLGVVLLMVGAPAISFAVDTVALSQIPLYIGTGAPPLNMLVVGRDHKMYYEAYNDASDLNGDGVVDIHYKPAQIDYYGYFDSHKCYTANAGRTQFDPTSITANKKCSGAWSGDFLNYLTMSRIDTLRRVLYGGKRSSDIAGTTVLERSYIPQDAHSWGKEYQSIARDGYDIADYAPLTVPTVGRYHLFANTSLLSAPTKPLLRVMTNSAYRVWEWLSIERPVAGDNCINRSTNCLSGSSTWMIAPSSVFTTISRKIYTKAFASPGTKNAFDTRETANAIPGNLLCESPATAAAIITNINGNGNPCATGGQDNFMTIITGTITVPVTGTYEFSPDGDDAVDFTINGLTAGHYGGHGTCGTDEATCRDTYKLSVTLNAGTPYAFKFRQEEATGGDAYQLYMKAPGAAGAARTDYEVRVKVCDSSVGLEANCKTYGANNKPTGLLQKYGDDGRMLFGLMSGSYMKNFSGGVLRKSIGNISTEIGTDGIFNNSDGIIKTLNNLQINDFGGNFEYTTSGRSPNSVYQGAPLDGQVPDWGNPIGETMFEALRYFTGKTTPTAAYNYTNAGSIDTGLSLPLPAWVNPYQDPVDATKSRPWCSKPFMTVISNLDINFDSDAVPGSFWNSGFSSDITGFNAKTLGDDIWAKEVALTPALGSKTFFVGESAAVNDMNPTAKTITSLGNLRGLAPSEPTRQGSYTSAEVAYFARTNGLGNPKRVIPSGEYEAKVNTFSVAMASPLPRIQVPTVSGKVITIVPFAKSPGGALGLTGAYQPTDQIVDFYVESIDYASPTNGGRYEAVFRINYEDVENGNDHDMDAIAQYTIKATAGGGVSVQVDSLYAAGGVIQHMGYVVSGSTTDGPRLVVRDIDTSAGNDIAIRSGTFGSPLDVPTWATSGIELPLTSTQIFTPGTGSSGEFLNDPLWFAAKWGGFDVGGAAKDVLDATAEWDSDGDGVPDNYYLVINPLKLEENLGKAFEDIFKRSGSSSAVATSSTSFNTGLRLYAASFNSSDWRGSLFSIPVTTSGKDFTISSTLEWDAAVKMQSMTPSSRKIITAINSGAGTAYIGKAFTWTNLNTTQKAALNTADATVPVPTVDGYGSDRLDYLRGVRTYEAGARDWRVRFPDPVTSPTPGLGDIVNSSPVYVGIPNQTGSEALNPGYKAFKTANNARTPVVYVGANDGMLHAFNAEVIGGGGGVAGTPGPNAGQEMLAYIPNAVYTKLSLLTNKAYAHQYTVDGTPYVSDVCVANCTNAVTASWKTMLAASFGAGVKGLYALNITDPSAFTEANAASIAMWEFASTDDANVGNIIGKPIITKVNSATGGRWAVIVNNGYNSATNKSVLFILYVEKGADGWNYAGGDYVRLQVDPTIAAVTTDGLSAVNVADLNGDGTADVAYAGDLHGNLWKFDLSSTNSANWKVSLHGRPLLKAKSTTSVEQPITSAPEITYHPEGDKGLIVYAGTGRYLATVDVSNTDIQSLYGAWDQTPLDVLPDGSAYPDAADATKDVLIAGRTDLLRQGIIAETAVGADFARALSDEFFGANDSWNTVAEYAAGAKGKICWRGLVSATQCNNKDYLGWVFDLTTRPGERIHVSPQLVGSGILMFDTLLPTADPCQFGGLGGQMFVDFQNGGALKSNPFLSSGSATGGTLTAAAIGGGQVISSAQGTVIVRQKSDSSGTGVGTTTVTSTAGSSTLNQTEAATNVYSKMRRSWKEILK